jgi:uncharacterized repeat protein (TIGR03803 family)
VKKILTNTSKVVTRLSGGTIASVLFSCYASAIAASAQTFTTLANFDGTDGSTPFNKLVQATDGSFYGTTGDGGNPTICPNQDCGTVFKITASGTLTTLYTFCAQTDCAAKPK